MQHAIVILNDGQTWTSIEGTKIVVLDDKQYDALMDDKIAVKNLKPTFTITLND
jgi:hypothetical protein